MTASDIDQLERRILALELEMQDRRNGTVNIREWAKLGRCPLREAHYDRCDQCISAVCYLFPSSPAELERGHDQP